MMVYFIATAEQKRRRMRGIHRMSNEWFKENERKAYEMHYKMQSDRDII